MTDVVMLAISGVIIPLVAYILWEIVRLKGTVIQLETRLEERQRHWLDSLKAMQDTFLKELRVRDQNCQRHQKWNEDTQRTIQRLDRNIVRLCDKQGVEYEQP